MARFLKLVPVRIAMVGSVILAMQATVFTEMRPFGVVCDFMLGFAIAAGVIGGPTPGMLAGFILGIMVDLNLATPFGLSPLVYGLMASLAGLVKSSITQGQAWWLSMILVFACSAIGVVAYGALGTLVGRVGWFRYSLLTDAAVIATANALIAHPATVVQRWALALTRDA